MGLIYDNSLKKDGEVRRNGASVWSNQEKGKFANNNNSWINKEDSTRSYRVGEARISFYHKGGKCA